MRQPPLQSCIVFAIVSPVITMLVVLFATPQSEFTAIAVAGTGLFATVLILIWMGQVSRQHFQALTVKMKQIQEALSSGAAFPIMKGPVVDASGVLESEVNSLSASVAARVNELLDANKGLLQSKQLFDGILGTMYEGVLVLDSKHQVVYTNRAALKMLDCQNRELHGKPFWEIVRTTELRSAIEQATQEERDFRKEFTLQRTKRVVEVSATKFQLSPAPGLIVVMHDVTELRRLERVRREFVANVSHELKTPLTSIQAYADSLLDGALNEPETAELFTQRILEQSERLEGLVKDMLRLAKIESEFDAFDLQLISVADALYESAKSRQAIVESKGLELTVLPGNEQVIVRADESGLQTIVDNLITNAVNYTPEGGTIQLRWFVDHPQQEVIIEVEDNGIGIAKEDRDRIFERFYRVDRARTRGTGGNGIGLAIVKHLTLVFGGRILVDSEVGRGSIFRVCLPLASDSSDQLAVNG